MAKCVSLFQSYYIFTRLLNRCLCSIFQIEFCFDAGSPFSSDIVITLKWLPHMEKELLVFFAEMVKPRFVAVTCPKAMLRVFSPTSLEHSALSTPTW